MKRCTKIAILMILLSALFWTGCGRGVGPSASYITNSIPNTMNLGFDYYISYTFSDWGGKSPRIYHEKIWRTKDNRYRIECPYIYEDVNNNGQWAMLPSSEVDKYNALLAKGQGHFAVFGRGFKITDPHLFLQNYNYTILNPDESYLNRTAIVVRITSLWQNRPNYTVWVDKETKLILKYIEDTPAVDPLTVMEVTDLDLNPDFSQVELFEFHLQKEPIDYGKSNHFSFRIFEPLYLPEGFDLEECLKVQVSNFPVFKLIYTDGIQRIVVSQFRFSNPVLRNALPGLSPSKLSPIVVGRSYQGGKYTSDYEMQGTHFNILSNVSLEEVNFMIESMTPIQQGE